MHRVARASVGSSNRPKAAQRLHEICTIAFILTNRGSTVPVQDGYVPFPRAGDPVMLTRCFALLLLGACARSDEWTWDIPEDFPLPWVPEDNPMTPAKVELGRHLFFDARLSGDGSQSCGSCHDQSIGFADSRTQSVGITGDLTPTNSPTLQNVAYYATHTWSDPFETLEEQIRIPLFGTDPVELGAGGNEDAIRQRISDDPTYAKLWPDAFEDAAPPYDLDQGVLALAAFVRSMVSADSPYDRWQYLRDDSAMSEDAVAGLSLFFSEQFECFHCHSSSNLSSSSRTLTSFEPTVSFENNGLYNVDGEGGYPPHNQGLYETTGLDTDKGRFRPPSLRNVALTAPYMHDGSIGSLQEVLAFYADGGRHIVEGELAGDGRENPNKSAFVQGFVATDQQLAQLTAFLEALTDDSFLEDPRFSDPWNE